MVAKANLRNVNIEKFAEDLANVCNAKEIELVEKEKLVEVIFKL
jgi:hypothetical protein